MKTNCKKFLLVTLILGVFLPVFDTQADIFGIGSLASGAVQNLFAYSLSWFFTILGKLLAVMVSMLDWVVRIRIYTDLPIIQSSWKIMRDFANMLFIIALIVMAYGTIFNIPKYDFKSLIPRFIIIAVLINFSLVLSGLVIDATQVLNNTFLNAMGDISGRLGQGLSPTALLPAGAQVDSLGTVADVAGASIVTLFFGIWFLFAFIVSVAVPLAVAFVRIPVLWALLIVSPLAWLLSILPATKGAYDKWWHQFLAWNLFLPYYLFFLYFALFFLSQQDVVLAGMLRGPAGQAIVNENFSKFGIQSSVTFGLLFYYILVGIFLIGGTKVAMSAGTFSGTGIANVAKWGRGVAMRRLGVTAAQRAAMQRLEQVKQEGLPGRFGQKLYGGDYGLAQQTGRWGERFGVRGAGRANEKAFVDRAGKDYTDFERQYQNGQITEAEVVSRAKQLNATDPRGFAYRKLAAKIGQLDPTGEIFTTTLQQLSKNPLAAEDFAKSAKEGKFSRMKGPDLARMAAAEKGVDSKTGIAYDYTSLRGSVAARREMYRYVQTDTKAMSGLNKDQFEAGLGVFGGHTTAEGKAFMKEVAKVAPDLVMSYNLDSTRNPDLRADTEEGFEKAYGAPHTNDFQLKTHVLSGSLKSGDFKETANIQLRVWNADKVLSALTTPPTPEQIQQAENAIAFKTALRRYVGQLKTRKARQTYVNNLEKALLNTPGGDKKISELYSDVLDPSYATTSVPVPLVPPTTPAATPLVP